MYVDYDKEYNIYIIFNWNKVVKYLILLVKEVNK